MDTQWTVTHYKHEPDAVLATDPRWPDALAYGDSVEDAEAMLNVIRSDLASRYHTPHGTYTR